jgi:hypothetical protein
MEATKIMAKSTIHKMVARSASCGRVASDRSGAVDNLIQAMRSAGEKLRSDPKASREYLLSTGFYTKDLKLKKRFR